MNYVAEMLDKLQVIGNIGFACFIILEWWFCASNEDEDQ